MAPEAEPALIANPQKVVRITRTIDPLAYSRVGAVEARKAKQGNRFDVPGGGVLYAATLDATCIHEVCSRFRPSAFYRSLNISLDEQEGFSNELPEDWRLNRRFYDLEISTDLPFVDISHQKTWKWLDERLPGLLFQRKLDHFDAEHVYSSDRSLTRQLAGEIYTATDAKGPRFAGIRYISRLNNGECWAIFEHKEYVNVSEAGVRSIEVNHQDLVAWSEMWSVTIK